MIIDTETPCPACSIPSRNLYAAARRVLERERQYRTPEYEELAAAVDAFRPFVDAHHANQLHAFSDALLSAREPELAEHAGGTETDHANDLAEERDRMFPIDARD